MLSISSPVTLSQGLIPRPLSLHPKVLFRMKDQELTMSPSNMLSHTPFMAKICPCFWNSDDILL